jgi:hypothetical protein
MGSAFSRPFFGQVKENNLRAESGESLGDCGSNISQAPGKKDNLSLKSTGIICR